MEKTHNFLHVVVSAEELEKEEQDYLKHVGKIFNIVNKDVYTSD